MLVVVFFINTIIVVATVLIHYVTLYLLAKKLPLVKALQLFRILFVVFAVLLAHVFEIWLFAIAYYFMIHTGDFGTLSGNFGSSLLDCVYFSFTTFTTLGYGDIEPSGHLRFLSGIESLVGLLMITWSASFIFLEMQKSWPKQ